MAAGVLMLQTSSITTVDTPRKLDALFARRSILALIGDLSGRDVLPALKTLTR